MVTVAVAGLDSDLGGRVLALLEGASSVTQIVAFDHLCPRVTRKLRFVDAGDCEGAGEVFARVSVSRALFLCDPSALGDVAGALELARRFSAALGRAAPEAVTLLSSSCAYGAHADQQGLFYEGSLLRPTTPVGVAFEEIEKLGYGLARSHPELRLQILRSAFVAGSKDPSFLGALVAKRVFGVGPELDPSFQFVHIDDLARALVSLALSDQVGVYNLAPPGTLSLSAICQIAELRLLRWPLSLLRLASRWRRLWGRPDLEALSSEWASHTRYSVLMANVKLRHDLGFRFDFTGPEAFLEQLLEASPGPVEELVDADFAGLSRVEGPVQSHDEDVRPASDERSTEEAEGLSEEASREAASSAVEAPVTDAADGRRLPGDQDTSAPSVLGMGPTWGPPTVAPDRGARPSDAVSLEEDVTPTSAANPLAVDEQAGFFEAAPLATEPSFARQIAEAASVGADVAAADPMIVLDPAPGGEPVAPLGTEGFGDARPSEGAESSAAHAADAGAEARAAAAELERLASHRAAAEGFAPDLTRGAGGPVAAEASARVAESGGAEAARGAASEPRADEKVEAALVGVAEVQPEGAREEPRLLLAGAAGSPGGGRSDTAAGDRAPVEGPPAQPSGDAPDLGSGRWVQIIPREAGEG